MGERPDMEAHHQGRWAVPLRQSPAQGIGRLAQHREGTVAGVLQPRRRIGRDAGLEHRGIKRGLATGKSEVGVSDRLERRERAWAALVEGGLELGGEALEAALGDIGEERVTIAKVAIGGRRADACRPGRLGKGEAGRSLGGDEIEGRPDQIFPEIAVMIPSAAKAAAMSRPTHGSHAYSSSTGTTSAGLSA